MKSRLDETPFALPFALIETDAKGMRIFAVNHAAHTADIKPAMRLSDARAICHQLQVREHDSTADARELSRIISWLERYTPMVAIYDHNTLLLDITGCAHLFGGEALMLADIQHRLAHIGYSIRAGLADTIGAAFALARYGERDINIVAPDKLHQGLAFLPVRALRLSQEQGDNLYGLGLKTIGHLFNIPRASLARRFSGIRDGASVLKRLDQATGLVGEPLEPHRRPPSLYYTLNPAEPCLHHEGIKAVFDTLLEQLLKGLEQQSQGLRKLSFRCFYSDGGEKHLTASFARPCRVKKHIDILFADQLIDIDPRFGLDGFVLSADQTDALQEYQNGLLGSKNQQDGKLSELIDRLVNRLGKQAVFQIKGYESHLPERAQNRVKATGITQKAPLPLVGRDKGWGSKNKACAQRIQNSEQFQQHVQNASILYPHPNPASGSVRPPHKGEVNKIFIPPHRPITIFAQPETITVIAEIPEGPPMQFRWRRVLRQVARARGPERIAPEWWTDTSGGQRIRDYYEVEDSRGQRYWLFRSGLYDDPDRTSPPNWHIHGLFL